MFCSPGSAQGMIGSLCHSLSFTLSGTKFYQIPGRHDLVIVTLQAAFLVYSALLVGQVAYRTGTGKVLHHLPRGVTCVLVLAKLSTIEVKLIKQRSFLIFTE